MVLFNDKLKDTFRFIISKDILQHGQHIRTSLEGKKKTCNYETGFYFHGNYLYSNCFNHLAFSLYVIVPTTYGHHELASPSFFTFDIKVFIQFTLNFAEDITTSPWFHCR